MRRTPIARGPVLGCLPSKLQVSLTAAVFALAVAGASGGATVPPLVDPWQPGTSQGARSVAPRDANLGKKADRRESDDVTQLRPQNVSEETSEVHGALAMPTSGLGHASARSLDQAVVRVREKSSGKGFGALLTDGRVLTALSVVGRGHDLSVELADGRVVAARVAYTHRGWDLALLSLQERVQSGLFLLEEGLDPGQSIHVGLMEASPGAPAEVAGRGWSSISVRALTDTTRFDVRGVDDVELHAVMLPANPRPSLGIPVVDRDNLLSGLVARACQPTPESACAEWRSVVIPASLLGRFLRQAPSGLSANAAAWTGVTGEGVDTGIVRGVRVLSVSPRSPGSRAGLLPGDVIIAVDSRPVPTLEAFGLSLVAAPVPAPASNPARRAPSAQLGSGEGADGAVKLLLYRAANLRALSMQRPTEEASGDDDRASIGPPQRPISGL